MNIVHTESSLGWGGQEIRILSESQGLIRRGHSVRLLCPPEARIFGEAPAWGVPVVGLPIGRKRPAGVRALLVMGRPYPVVRTRHISAPVSTSALSRWLYTRATSRIVTTGERLKKELVERNGFPAARIESVPTGVDPQRFRPGDKAAARSALKLPPEGLLVGIVATLRSWKGHLFLIDAMAEVPQAGLVIVGDGPMRAQLEARVDQHGMRARTWFAGNQKDVVPWLQALDVFALPSYANEGVPQALLQAMLTGLPCVTTSAGSIEELAKDGDTGLIVPQKQVAPLRAAIQRLLQVEPLRRRLGEAARRHCEANFSYQAMLDKMERIYREASSR